MGSNLERTRLGQSLRGPERWEGRQGGLRGGLLDTADQAARMQAGLDERADSHLVAVLNHFAALSIECNAVTARENLERRKGVERR